MTRPVDDPRDATPKAVLDRVRPTVVVRRRVVDVAPTPHPVGYHDQASPKAILAYAASAATDDDDNGPPSSVNVARALASLRVDELRRLEEIVSADDDPVEPPVAVVPTIRMGPSMALVDLAEGMGIPKQELVTALVTRGFFSVTVKTVLPRETGRTAAAMFGFRVEDHDEIVAAPTPRSSAKVKDAKHATAATKGSAKAKSTKKKTARRRG